MDGKRFEHTDSPFNKGGLRGIFRGSCQRLEIPPSPPLRKGGIMRAMSEPFARSDEGKSVRLISLDQFSFASTSLSKLLISSLRPSSATSLPALGLALDAVSKWTFASW